jgi:ketosteroid isomerase-like protein
MTAKTQTKFDIDSYKRSYEGWDVEVLLNHYADEVELIQIDRDNPPSAPRTRQGKDVFRGMFEHCAAAGAEVSVEHGIADGDRAAVAVTCVFPGGRTVVSNVILELEDGRIVREREVLAGDPKN